MLVAERVASICRGPASLNPGYQGYWTSGQRLDFATCGSNLVWKAYPGVNANLDYEAWKMNEPSCSSNAELCVAVHPMPDSGTNDYWQDADCGTLLCPLCELHLGF